MTKKDAPNNVEYPLPDDWRGKVMSKIRLLIKQADPEVIEDVKWKKPTNPAGNLVWYHDGMICTGEIYKIHLRLGFAKGPELKNSDPKGLINSHRAVIIHEEDKIDETAFKDLIRAAVELNSKKAK
jgi:hypothetical protein